MVLWFELGDIAPEGEFDAEDGYGGELGRESSAEDGEGDLFGIAT